MVYRFSIKILHIIQKAVHIDHFVSYNNGPDVINFFFSAQLRMKIKIPKMIRIARINGSFRFGMKAITERKA